MPSRREQRHALPTTRTLTVIAQDPSVRANGTRGEVLITELTVPAEELLPGPCGHRVNVIDYDASTHTLYEPGLYQVLENGTYEDPFAKKGRKSLLDDPKFHAQNVYAIAMRTLAQFEFALGRRVPWGSDGHQIHIAPHAFAEANAFYSRADRAIFFGYFFEKPGKPVFTCLSHDVVAHETTHALLDGLRSRYMEPSSPDQAAFHEGFADVVALLSVLSLEDVVEKLLTPQASGRARRLIDAAKLTREALSRSVLLRLAEEMGSAVSQVRGEALRRSVEELTPGTNYIEMKEFREPHRRGELLVAAMMNTFLTVWLTRLKSLGFIEGRKRDLKRVVEDGAKAARHLLTMSIRAIDYCPPTDLWFPDYLSALLTVDREVVPDDKYDYRGALLDQFAAYGMKPASDADKDGTWKRFGNDKNLVYGRTHYDSMLRDLEEVFRFVWENRKQLELTKDSYVEIQTVLPCVRIGPDGFVLRETVAEYIEILTLTAGEMEAAIGIAPPPDLPRSQRIRLFGGGALIFDEYGQLKYQIANHIANNDEDRKRQRDRLDYMLETGFFDQVADPRSHFAVMHLTRATS